MAPLDWTTIFTAAPQLITAVVFGFFVLRLLDRQDKQTDKRDNEWRLFLLEARTNYTDSIKNIASQMAAVAETTRASNHLLTNHDAWERAEMVRERAERAAALSETAKLTAEAIKAAAVVTAAALEKSREKG